MATLILILRVLTVIFGAAIFTAILVMSKEFWEDDKLIFVAVIFCRCVCCLPHDFCDSDLMKKKENAG